MNWNPTSWLPSGWLPDGWLPDAGTDSTIEPGAMFAAVTFKTPSENFVCMGETIENAGIIDSNRHVAACMTGQITNSVTINGV